MDMSPLVLDHERGIVLDRADPPFNNYQAFGANCAGLKILATSVRELERAYLANDPHAEQIVFHLPGNVPELIPCAFNWFSVTLVNYLRLVALVDLMKVHGLTSTMLVDPQHRQMIRTHCTEYVREAVPEVHLWRNKVAARFAASDPFHGDNLGTLEQSIMDPVVYTYPYYYVGLALWNAAGSTSQLTSWALTKVYEDLRSRFWPEITLRAVKE